MKLEICSISKNFGKKTALDDISFTAETGRPTALLGRNGAGKTTLMRIIMNIFLPDCGEILLDGKPASSMAARLGYLPEERGLYHSSPIDEQLIYLARLRGMSANDARTACARWLDRLGMSEHSRSRPETLSKGNQQRIQLAMALLHDPDVVILDEPFSGLDPVNAKQLQTLINELADSGKLVIISSHQMSAVENACDHVLMLNSGRLALDTTLNELRSQSHSGTVKIRTTNDSEAQSIAAAFGDVSPLSNCFSVSVSEKEAQKSLLRALQNAPLDLLLFEVSAPSLEELFVSVCGSSSADEAPQPTGGAN